MNTTTILLGATCAVLLTAVIISFNGMVNGVSNASPDELARISSQIEQLRKEQEKLMLENQIRDLQGSGIKPTSSADFNTDYMRMQQELAAKEAEIAALSAEKNAAQKKADTYRDEAGFIAQRDLEKNDKELRRARMIKNALLIGRITEIVKNPEIGDFIVFQVIMPEQVNIGDTLAIRRNTGILGRITITDVTPEGAIANTLPGFGKIEPKSGDELIIPPLL